MSDQADSLLNRSSPAWRPYRGMQSLRALLGSLSLLAALPLAFLTSVGLSGGETVVVHAAFGAGMLLLAAAAFDFGVPRIVGWIGMCATLVLGAIFLAQGVAELVQSPALFAIVYGDPTVQAVERLAAYPLLFWCIGVLLAHSRGRLRVVGAISIAAIAAAEAYSYWVVHAGGTPDIMLRLTYLLAFVWLALEGSSSACTASSVAAPFESWAHKTM
jgi:hypothetical protein